MRARFIVSLDVPEGCTRSEVKEYVEDAVKSWRGSYDPNDYIFDLDADSVKVTHVRPPTRGIPGSTALSREEKS